MTLAKLSALERTKKDNGKENTAKLCFQLLADAFIYSKRSCLVNCTNF